MSEHENTMPMSLGGRLKQVRGKLPQAEFGWFVGRHRDEKGKRGTDTHLIPQCNL